MKQLLAEHGDPEQGIILRDFDCSWLMKNLVGPIGFGDHAKHHQSMALPFTKLDDVKVEPQHLPVHYDRYEGHHLKLLWHWFCQLPATKPTQGER